MKYTTIVHVKCLNKQHTFFKVEIVAELFNLISNEWEIPIDKINLIYNGDELAKKGLSFNLINLNQKEITAYVIEINTDNSCPKRKILHKIIKNGVNSWSENKEFNNYDKRLRIIYNTLEKQKNE